VDALEGVRKRILTTALADPRSLRAMVGPVLPVRLERVSLRLVALGDAFPAEFDLNSMGLAELSLLSPDPALRDKIDAALDRGAFASYGDFETRSGVTLASLGAAGIVR
jgi:hypothetical protein